jgi:hypothetical protein
MGSDLLKHSTINRLADIQALNNLSSIIKPDNDIMASIETRKNDERPLIISKTYKIDETKIDKESLFEVFESGIEDEFELHIDATNFNIFNFIKRVDRSNVMPIIYNEILNRLEIRDTYVINNSKVEKFIVEIRDGYKANVLYHNELHASDLCQTLFAWINKAAINTVFHFTKLDLISIYTAAIVHDYKHPGFTNGFQMNNLTEIALTYNDKSVLENMHISESFRVLLKPTNNFFENFSVP